MEHKRGTEGDRSFKLGDRLKDPSVVVVILFLAFGVYSLFSSDITGKLIARPQNECSAAGGAAAGVMLLGNAGPFQIAGAAQKQNTCGVPAQRPAGELKQFLLLGTRCEAGADGIITLSLENGNTQRLKSACALPSYDETPHSDKLVKHICAGNDVQVNLLHCNCLNGDCDMSVCVNNDQCLALPDGTTRGCQDKNNGLGKRCYKTADGTPCAFADECGQGLVCRGGACMSEAQALAAPAAPPVPPVPVGGAVPPPPPPPELSPVEILVRDSPTSVVGRMIRPINPLPGADVTVTLIINEVGDEGSYIIEETVPVGWEIIDHGGLTKDTDTELSVLVSDAVGGTVQDTRYTYHVRTPQELGQGTFTGTFRFESMAAPAALIGDTEVTMPDAAERFINLPPEMKDAITNIAIERGAIPTLPIIPPAGELNGACRSPVQPGRVAPLPPCNIGLNCEEGVCAEAGGEEPAETILLNQELKLGDAADHSKFVVITFTPTFTGDSPFITFVLTTLGMAGADSPGFAENYALVYNKDGGYEIFRLNDQIRAAAGEQSVHIQVAKQRLKNNDLNFLYLVAGNRNNDYADFSVKKIVVEGATLGPEILVNNYNTAGERAAGMLGQLEGVLIAHKAGGQLKQTGEPCQEDRECSAGRCVGTEAGRRCASPRGGADAQGGAPQDGGQNKADGTGCAATNECAEGLVCRRLADQNTQRFYGEKKCKPPRNNGAACEANDYCASGNCVNNICAPAGGAGNAAENVADSVNAAAEAVNNAFADAQRNVANQLNNNLFGGGSNAGGAVQKKADGVACAVTGECAQGLVCRKLISRESGNFYGDKKCKPPRNNGATCEENDYCASGNCENGICAPAGGGGAPAKKPNAQTCSAGFECISGLCAKDGKAVTPRQAGVCTPLKVICTELNRQGLMPDAHLKASAAFADKFLDKTTMHGYHYWAKPLVRVMQRSPKVTMLVAPLGLAWGRYVAYEMGVSKDSSAIGEILVKQGEAASREIGVFLETNGLAGEVDEKTMEALAYKHLAGMFAGSETEIKARLKERMPGFFADIKAYAQSQKLYKPKN